MIVLGIDPDAVKHGVAVYNNGVLTGLFSMTLVDLHKASFFNADLIAIEHVCANNGVFTKDPKRKIGRARSLGRVQQSQAELERFADHYEIKIKHYRISSSWKSAAGKKQMEKITGWSGRSNEDTRSAAYFGFLAAVKHKG